MKPKRLRTQQAGGSLSLALSAVQDAMRAATDANAENQLLDGVLINTVSVGTTETRIEHKLSRQPLGWILTDQDTAATVRRSAWDDRHLTLVASAACHVSLWVF